jgi:hypothetical protein
MNPLRFSLKPFPGEGNGPDVKITGRVARMAGTLSLECALLGNLSTIAIPEPRASPGRKDRLWEETCLEVFLGESGSERYWEFNLSPARDWNVYRFPSYRKEKLEELAFTALPFRIRTEPGALRLSLDLGLEKIIPADSAIEVGVCAVLRTVTGARSHWALAHPSPRPDFHRRNGFTLKIPPGGTCTRIGIRGGPK